MPRPTRGYTKRITLRTTDLEGTIVRQKRAYLAECGVTLSENDTINFLIQCAAVPLALTLEDARADLNRHMDGCEDCDPTEPPRVRCAAGIHLRDHWARLKLRADHEAAQRARRRPIGGLTPLMTSRPADRPEKSD